MPSFNYLYRRNAVYWFRRRVPTGMEVALDRPDWRESLRTKSLAEAKVRLHQRTVETDQEIALAMARQSGKASQPLSLAQARQMAEAALGSWLAEDERARANNGTVAWREAEGWLEACADEIRQELAQGKVSAARRDTVEALEASGLFYPEEDASFVLLAYEMLKARAAFLEAITRRQRGVVVQMPTPGSPPRPAERTALGGVTIAQLIAAYRAERERKHGKESTDRKYGHIFRALEEALGSDTPVRGVRREDCRRVRALLERVPSNANKIYPGLSLTDAADAADRDGRKRLAPNTLGSYMNNLSAILNWAVTEEWLEKNPAKGLVGKNRPTVKRRGFTPDELRTVFSGLRQRETDPWRYWVPALALFTGARASELCQLNVADVVDVGGVLCLDLSEFDPDTGLRVADKSLKTASSERYVPVHDQLLRAGFAAFVEDAKAAGALRLFPELKLGSKGSYSQALSRWFARFLDNCGLSQPSLVFHSFRHGFRDACRRGGVQEETGLALGGWAAENQAAKYGDRGMVPLLNDALGKIAFGDFDLASAA